MERIRQSGQRVEKLDKTLIDHHIAELDFQISRQLDAVMHHQEFQQVESCGAASNSWWTTPTIGRTSKRRSSTSQRRSAPDFEDAPELIQSGLYWHTYTAEYDTPAASRSAR